MLRKLMILAALLVCLLSFATGHAMASSEPEDTTGDGIGVVEPSQGYDSNIKDQANAANLDLDRIEKALFQGLYQCQETIDISALGIPYKKANVDLISSLIHDEMPECFHVNGFSYGYSGGKITRIKPNYTIEKAQYQQMYAQMQAAADRLLQNIAGNSKLDDVTKALLIHDRLALLCEYDYNSGDNRHNSYGALVAGAAVCQGYAEAYDFLLEKVGIDGYICESLALNHAWNIIYINEKPYHVDVTWDDYSWASGERGAVGAVEHENFLRSSTGIYSTKHTANDYDTSPKDTTYDDYFWQTSDAALLMIDDEIYYIDGDANQLKRYSDQEPLCTVKSRWRAENGYYWVGNFARLTTDGKDLFYSLADAVYKYDLATGEQTEIFAPELGEGLEIYGLVYEDGYLVCDINAGPPGSSVTYLHQIKQSYQSGPEKADDLVFLQAPSLSFQDYIGMQLLVNGSLADTYDELYVEAIQIDPVKGAVTTKLVGMPYYGAYLLFDQKILSWSMAEEVTLTMYGVKDGVVYVGQSYTASVESLALSMLPKNASNAKVCRILVDMLNYGAAVQTTFNHNADYLPNTNLGEYADMGTAGDPEMSATNSSTGTGSVSILQTSVSMQSKVEIQLAFTGDISAYTPKATIGAKELTCVVDADTYAAYGMTAIRIAIGAANMRDTVTFALYDGETPVTAVQSISVEALVKNLTTSAQGNVILAMMRYGDAVAAFAAG